MNQTNGCQLFMIILIFHTGIFAAGCEHSFEPLNKDHPFVFSMFGAVDLHGEFSRVRVMPIGEVLIPTDPKPNGTMVTLIRDSTGVPIILADSLFRFGGDAYVWNYFTEEHLYANENYTIVAKTSDGRRSHAAISLPPVLPFPEAEYSAATERGVIWGWSAEPIVAVEIVYLLQIIEKNALCSSEMEVVINNTKDVVTYPNGEYRVEVDNRRSLSDALGPGPPRAIQINMRELNIVSSGDDWPDTSGLTDLEMVLPDQVTNVENGIGLVAGIAGRSLDLTPRREPC